MERSRKIEAGIQEWYRADIALQRFEQRQRQAQRASVEQFLQDAKETDLATSGEVYVHDASRANAFAKISRYDTSLERSFYKVLHDLERRQALRQGKDVPVPLAVDIDVSGAALEALRITAGDDPQVVEGPSSEPKTPRPIR